MDIKYAGEVILALRQAGKMMTSHTYTEVTDKGDIANLVTDMDVKVQEFLIQALSSIIPGSSFLAEESDKHEESDGFMWVIDPIDGTTNYIYDYKHSAISIALVENHEAILGAVYDPYLDEMFVCGKGSGAYLNEQPIRVSKNSLSASLIMCGTTPYDKAYAQITFDVMRRMFMAGKDIRRSGSAVLDLCYVACGRVDGFFEQRLAPWDFAAGALMILEAGGRIMTIDGPLQYGKKIGMIAGNANNIEDLIEITGRNAENIIIGTCHGVKPIQIFPENEPVETKQEVPAKEIIHEPESNDEPIKQDNQPSDDQIKAVKTEAMQTVEPLSMELLQEEAPLTKEEIKASEATLDSILEDMVKEQKDV